MWIIGASKVGAILRFKAAAIADWTDAQGLLEICSPQANAAIPSDIVMHAGKANTGTKCTGVYQYTVGLASDLVSTGYLTRK